jgi:hypothetical protein
VNESQRRHTDSGQGVCEIIIFNFLVISDRGHWHLLEDGGARLPVPPPLGYGPDTDTDGVSGPLRYKMITKLDFFLKVRPA